ncbi:MAG: 2-dehydropantoate 2-reductase [Verrucomicrobiota bacterium]
MEIIVLGAGAIGSLYGAKLAAAGNQVTLIGRPAHVDAINLNGLRIEGLESAVVRLRAATIVNAIQANTLVLVTTKVPDTGAAVSLIVPLVRDDTTIVSLQNGLASEEIVREALQGRGLVLRGFTQFGAIFKTPGVIEFLARGYTVLERHERSNEIARILTAADLDCRISSDIRRDVWYKLIVNCVVNPITAILGCEVRGIANTELAPLKRLVVEECLAVAATEGIKFETDLVREIDDFFRSSHNVASMLQDLRRRRPTEIDYLNGAVAALGARKGIDCPVNAALAAIIKAMEAASLVPQKMLEPETA